MISFKNDYSEGAHPQILEALVKSNLDQQEGYGNDDYCKQAVAVIRETFALKDEDVHFLVGGTQTNLIAISSFLKPYEAVIAVESGHIAVHETGAIEATGHKVIITPTVDGKITIDSIQNVLDEHTDEHMVKPKMVYISNPTEVGTIYYKEELEAISRFCKEHQLLFYIDGARLGSALCAKENDVAPQDLAQLTDAFYIGGTKNGALFGEALILCKDELKENFRFSMKQRGGLLAKGRTLGVQFYELFKGDLYFDMARHMNQMAEALKQGIKELGYDFYVDSPTNQLFPILPNEVITALEQNYLFYRWAKVTDKETAIRLVTSWATEEEVIHQFLADLKQLTKKD